MDEISSSDTKLQAARPHDAATSISAIRATMDKFLSAANVEAVFAPPIRKGESIVIPAAEIWSAAGFGLGSGGGTESGGQDENIGSGAGGGGGGHVFSRPVAAIVITPAGVRVEPIVDVTKIALAVFTTLGFMAAMFTRMSNKKPPKLTS